MSHHSPSLDVAIARVTAKLRTCNTSVTARVMESLHELGPNCFASCLDNEEQAKGAVRLLEWLEVSINTT